MKEEKGWGLDPEGLLKAIIKLKESGFCPLAIVVKNLGNPTLQVMKYDDLAQITKIYQKHSILILSDGV